MLFNTIFHEPIFLQCFPNNIRVFSCHVKKILEEALGVKPQTVAKNRMDFEEFCGIWSDLELTEFEEKTKDLSRVNHEDWGYKNCT